MMPTQSPVNFRKTNFKNFQVALIDVHGGEKNDLKHDDQSVTYKVVIRQNSPTMPIESVNKVDIIDIACEENSQRLLGSRKNRAELSDTSYTSGIDDAECDPKEDMLLLEAILHMSP
ncbi:hypothetical protein Tco_0414018 [Tanacetum coccineum]